MTAISGAAMRCKTMMDGSLRIEVEVEPQDAQQAFALFGRPGAPMALAALAVGHAAAKEPEPEKPKGGIRAQWVAMRCNEPAFQSWVIDKWGHIRTWPLETPLKQIAADLVRAVCGVESRAELDNDKDAGERFDRLIRGPWSLYYGAAAA